MVDGRTRISAEQRNRDVLSALGDAELTISELVDRLIGSRGWEPRIHPWGLPSGSQLSSLVYAALQRLRQGGSVTRTRTARGPARWRYFKVERPPTGEFAAIVAALRTEEKAGG